MHSGGNACENAIFKKNTHAFGRKKTLFLHSMARKKPPNAYKIVTNFQRGFNGAFFICICAVIFDLNRFFKKSHKKKI